VRKGTDVRLGRVVAVKRLRPDLAADPTFQARFRREAQSAAALNHPAIAAVYDTGEEPATDGSGVAQPYIVMEYVAGRTLREILREGRKILPERALEITSGVLAALDFSHRAGIIHRDIKPANVMLTPAGDVKVMDFGIARAVADSSQTMTQTAAVVGTAQYLSPEQARGETVDSRSDVYSAGCLLYELLTGRPPFVGESPVSVAYQHVREVAVPPSSLDPDLPPEVDAIVMKALAKRVSDRYQSAAAMRSDIERFLAGKPVTAPAVPVDAGAPFVPTDDASSTTTFFGGRADDDEGPPPKRWPLVVLALAVIALIAGALIFGPRLFNPPANTIAVPSVHGMTETKAAATLTHAGLTLGRVDRRASPTVPRGQIIDQTPEPLDQAEPGSAVDVVVSTGPPNVVVPSVIGQDKAIAKQTLLDKGLKVRLIKRASDQKAGTVIATNPDPAVRVTKGSLVKVFFAAGPKKVPSVVGLTEDQARSKLAAAGFTNIYVVTDSTTPSTKGLVLKQSPPAYTAQPQGTTIILTVSAYEPPSSAPPSPTTSPTESPSP
ncbi:MAG: Stk1 family PASTA domain-containing Ser/Thr kinase, partial [Nocardioidaceae bacterium]